MALTSNINPLTSIAITVPTTTRVVYRTVLVQVARCNEFSLATTSDEGLDLGSSEFGHHNILCTYSLLSIKITL
jgi:hypothetical protein